MRGHAVSGQRKLNKHWQSAKSHKPAPLRIYLGRIYGPDYATSEIYDNRTWSFICPISGNIFVEEVVEPTPSTIQFGLQWLYGWPTTTPVYDRYTVIPKTGLYFDNVTAGDVISCSSDGISIMSGWSQDPGIPAGAVFDRYIVVYRA